MSTQFWLQLSLTTGIGPTLARRMIELAGTPAAACRMSARDLQNVEGIGTGKSTKIHASLRAAEAEAVAELDRAAARGVTIISPADNDYPILLRIIPDPPLVLYVRGSFQPRDLHGVAIVGSRKCSYYGREQAERFGALIGGAGLTVLSGGARGIDSSAHRGAMTHPQGRTIAVLGSGVDVAYPPENASLFEQIAARGAVVSEYALGTPPIAENFPRRNRIVSGLSRAVLVIEADVRSGALITARQAGVDHGRAVLALPGRVDNALSVGPHALIRDGATLVTCLQDVLDALTPLPQLVDEIPDIPIPYEEENREDASDAADGSEQLELPHFDAPTPMPSAPAGLSERQSLILSHLSREPRDVDAIMDATELDASVIQTELTLLTLKAFGNARRRIEIPTAVLTETYAMQLDLNLVKCFVARRSASGDSYELLLLLRSPGRFMAGTWQIVSGGIEAGETASRAALRELREETGLLPVELYQLNYVSQFYLAHTDRIYFAPYFCAIVAHDADIKLNAEHDAFRWLTREAFVEQLIWPGDRLATNELVNEILGNGKSKPYQKLVVN